VTPQTEALQLLADTLAGLAADDELDGDERCRAIIGTFVATPLVWPLDDFTFEVMLSWAGLDLDSPAGLEMAADIAAFLDGTGEASVRCGHGVGERSALCDLRKIPRVGPAAAGAAAMASGELAVPLAIRRAVEVELSKPESTA
jgi:hypothetical protein